MMGPSGSGLSGREAGDRGLQMIAPCRAAVKRPGMARGSRQPAVQAFAKPSTSSGQPLGDASISCICLAAVP